MARNTAKQELREISMAEVQQHTKPGDVWVVFQNQVLDLSSWANKHPGGHHVIMAVAGLDATDEIIAMHCDEIVEKLVPRYVIGKVANSPPLAPHVIEYRSLIQSVIHDPEWMVTDFSYYYKLASAIAVAFSMSIALYLGTTSLAVHFIAGLLMGISWQQLLLIGHDAGHAGITHNPQTDKLIGWVVGSLLNGFSINWWCVNHNTHHVATNSVEHDPDIQYLPFVAITDKFFSHVYSSYYGKEFTFDKFAKAMVTVQHVTYNTIMVIARIFVHVKGIELLLDMKQKIRQRIFDLFGMILYFTWYIGLVVFLGGYFGRSSSSMVVYAMGCHFMSSLIHIQITLNHFATNTHSDANNSGARGGKDFITAQLHGTIDIACPPFMDWIHGGLQFQVEHHLCPRMPRHNLRRFKPLIVDLARRHNLPYEAIPFTDALLRVRTTLAEVAKLAHTANTK
eukprot:c20128_g1_i1.p1 GENE.c20128_g1_i1~~c20128_g1_i1.p1  ORF type:complete len:472 (+),score=96.52 c20128_g1_i1:61-1416(+)